MRFLGFLIEDAEASDAREQRRVSEMQYAQDRIRALEKTAYDEHQAFEAQLTGTVDRYEQLLAAAVARADSMVSPSTVNILQEEIVHLRRMLTDAGARTDRLVDQHHEIAMKPAPAPQTLMGSLGDMSGMAAPHLLDGFPKTQAALRMLSAGQSRPSREAMLNTAIKYKAGNLTDEQIEKLLHKGEGYRE